MVITLKHRDMGKRKYILVDSYRNENERINLLYWQLT